MQDQLLRIFKVLGTPSEATWPGVSALPEFNPDCAMYPPLPLEAIIPDMEPDGYDLFAKMCAYQPEKRVTCEEALKHPFFADVQLPEGIWPFTEDTAKPKGGFMMKKKTREADA